MSPSIPAMDVRPSPLAGTWYPGDPAQLAQSVDSYLDRAEVAPIDGRLIGVLAPHAGHRYSGAVAAHAFKLARGMDIDLVAVLGPSHYPYRGPVVTARHDAYSTPLGTVPVAHDLLDALSGNIPLQYVREDQEHSLENEIPFLQRALGEFRLLPLALVDQSLALAELLGATLGTLLSGQKALLVASSDLSHFYPQGVANELDAAMLSAVEAYDPASVIRVEDEGRGFACGRGAIAAVMMAAHALGAESARVVSYATSGDVTGDYAQVVGYGAAIFFASAQQGMAQ